MSVCLVAQFPWTAIRTVTLNEPAGAIVCSDTRLTSAKGPVGPWLWSKQEPIGKNIVVCFTSSNAAATIRALKSVRNQSSVKAIGDSLRQTHLRFGGITELLVVVSRRYQAPQILELMPPNYTPRPRRGIVGIGDLGVLRWFRENFVEDPTPELLAQPPAHILEGLARAVGHPIQLPPVKYPIEQAALHIGAAFSEAIRQAGGPTVSLPVQVITVTHGEARALGITSSADLETWEDVTADREKVRLVRPNPAVVKPDAVKRSAIQLFV